MVEGTKQIYLSTEEFQGGHFKLGKSLHIVIIGKNICFLIVIYIHCIYSVFIVFIQQIN